MLERVITSALRHRWIVIGLIFVWSACGFWALNRLNIDAFPDTTPVQVQINTSAPSLVPEEIERQITFPIEVALSGMPGLEQMRSISQFGLSQVVVTFRDGTNIYFARQLVNERLISVEMPEGISRPEMGPVSTGLGEVFHYLVYPNPEKGADLTSVKTVQDWVIKPQMRPVPGTAEVNSWGGLNKQYQIRVDPARLSEFDLTFQDVIDAVHNNNTNVGGGNMTRGGDMLLVHGIGRTIDIEEIGSIVIKAHRGNPVLVRSVADVVIGHQIRRGAVTAEGQGEAVLGLGFMLMGESSYTVTNRMAAKFNELNQSLPDGVEVKPVYVRTELVDEVIDTVRKNLSEGAIFVIIILFIFLGDIRAGLVAACAIPLSMLFAFFGMYWAGVAGTLLSLGAIDFGIVVDSSVVVIESIIHHLAIGSHGKAMDAPPSGTPFNQRLNLVRDAVFAAKTPAVFGQLIIMIVYIPILTLEGVEGKMFRPMALTVVFVLLGSLILSLTVIPVLSYFFLPKKPDDKDVFLVAASKWMYRPLLDLTLRFRWAVIGLGTGLLIVALMIALGFGAEFVPRLSEGAIVIGINRPPGTSLEQSVVINTRMERALKANFPSEIKFIWSRQGAPEVATDPGSIESTDIFIMLHPRSRWTKATNQSDLVLEMEKLIAQFPGQTTWFTQPIEMRINEMLSGVRADVAIKVFGDDLEVLTSLSKEISAILGAIPGCSDLTKEQVLGQPVVQVQINREKIARLEIPAERVLDVVESVGGKVVGDLVEGQLRFPIVVRLPESMRGGPDDLRAISITSPRGVRIPLSDLTTIREVQGAKTITREMIKRRITIQCNVRGRDLAGFVADAQNAIAAKVQLPGKDFRIEWGGQFENMQRAQQRLAIVAPLALSLIIVLLFLTYRNGVDTSLVFTSVPFSCVGGIVALWLREMPLSISAAIGFITLSGVSVLSSMVVVSALREKPDWRTNPDDALRRAWMTTLRTVIMTALVASVGFVPMALSDGTGAEVQRPLATVVIGGVISSMLTTLFILPALYSVALQWFKPRTAEFVEDHLGPIGAPTGLEEVTSHA